jgi:hypothetical protein
MQPKREVVGPPGSGRGVSQVLDLKAGDWVAVRSQREVLTTLDQNACLDELPFMPQMLRYCGMKFQVRKRAHKLCDTVHGTGARRMADAVFLDGIQCDGVAYGGCEMACSIVWKEAWLRRADEREVVLPSEPDDRLDALAWRTSRHPSPDQVDDDPIYVCQATKLPAATRPLPWWNPKQYVVDYRSGNATLSAIVGRLLFLVYSQLVSSGIGLGSALRWLYNVAQAVRGGEPYPVRTGRLPVGGRTPTVDLGLQVGDLVRVKTMEQILDTVDKRLGNRGLGFHPEMAPYCGKTFRVKQRLHKILNEKTGRLMTLKNSCLVLDGVGCNGRYTQPLNCPRALPPYWREIWLERVETGAASSTAGDEAKRPAVG